MTDPGMISPISRWLPAWMVMLAVATARAADAPAVPTFDHDVQPVLKARCIKCHGADQSQGKAEPLRPPIAGARW